MPNIYKIAELLGFLSAIFEPSPKLP